MNRACCGFLFAGTSVHRLCHPCSKTEYGSNEFKETTNAYCSRSMLVDVGGQPTSCSAGASHSRDRVALNIIHCDLTSEISSREREAPDEFFWARTDVHKQRCLKRLFVGSPDLSVTNRTCRGFLMAGTSVQRLCHPCSKTEYGANELKETTKAYCSRPACGRWRAAHKLLRRSVALP